MVETKRNCQNIVKIVKSHDVVIEQLRCAGDSAKTICGKNLYILFIFLYKMIDKGRLIVLYGSQTFTAQEAAERIWRTTKILDFKGPVQAMDDYPISRLIHEQFALFICATTGQGDEPDNMRKFWKFLLRKSLPSNSLVNLKFGVIGFGDSKYSKFNFVAKKLYKRLIQLGAKPLLDLGKL